MKSEILTLLREQDGYISGQELCDRFGVSRTAVWKAIKQLKESGYDIEAVPNKGYHLAGQKDVLTQNEIESRMHTKWIGKEVYYKELTVSTNLDVKKLLEDGAKEGVLVVGGQQTQGRGRRGRSWQSPPDTNIYMSLGLRPDYQPDIAPMVTLIQALAVAKAVQEVCGLQVEIKWPNDVVIHGRKICGILTEMSAETGYIQYVVIGTGINVNNTSFAPEIADRATSLGMELDGRHVPEAAITCEVLRCFHENYRLFLETDDLSALMETYNAMLVSRGREVRVEDPLGPFTGTASGIDRTGCLLVTAEDGSVRRVASGEVSVRGIGGYI